MATPANRRKIWIASLGVCVLVCLWRLLHSMRLIRSFLTPATTQQIVIFTGLSIVAFLLFVAVLILLVRNVLKLYADQRSRVMGTRLRTRMLWGAVLVSLIPIASMYRVQLSAFESRGGPVVLAAGDGDARRQQQHGV